MMFGGREKEFWAVGSADGATLMGARSRQWTILVW